MPRLILLFRQEKIDSHLYSSKISSACRQEKKKKNPLETLIRGCLFLSSRKTCFCLPKKKKKVSPPLLPPLRPLSDAPFFLRCPDALLCLILLLLLLGVPAAKDVHNIWSTETAHFPKLSNFIALFYDTHRMLLLFCTNKLKHIPAFL